MYMVISCKNSVEIKYLSACLPACLPTCQGCTSQWSEWTFSALSGELAKTHRWKEKTYKAQDQTQDITMWHSFGSKSNFTMDRNRGSSASRHGSTSFQRSGKHCKTQLQFMSHLRSVRYHCKQAVLTQSSDLDRMGSSTKSACL